MSDKHKMVNQTSGNTEWYSPPELVLAARRVMGDIDFDPASSYRANSKIVKATGFYSAPGFVIAGYIDDLPVREYDLGGLSGVWSGRVWMNHPFGSAERACKPNCTKKTCLKRGWHAAADIPGNEDWINRVVSDYRQGIIEQACVLTFAATSEAWLKPLKDFPQCYPDGRTNYLDPITLEKIKGVPKGSVVTYLGINIEYFAEEFDKFGAVMVPFKLTQEAS